MKSTFLSLGMILSTLAFSQPEDWCEFEFWQNKDTTDFLKIEVFRGPTVNCEKLPDKFYNMINLKVVEIDPAGLLYLSPKISQLQKLEKLHISKSKLTVLPVEIGELKSLRVLAICFGGQLQFIPEEVGQLSKLERLDLSRNKLSTLPESIGQLKNLKRLRLSENNFDEEERNRIRTLLPNCEIIFDY